MKILLVCSAGMSTDILRGELIKYAKKEQLPLEVKAVGVHAYKEYCTGYDPSGTADRIPQGKDCGGVRKSAGACHCAGGLCRGKCRTHTGTGREHTAWIR